ncbi:uncharacterized protein [Pyrus communis]|uniref:uncharacterized protein n=1 Tax=Pyrus communis TaxID=23211 RepID=UPI0035C037D3
MTNRLKKVIPKVISLNQSAFMAMRQISDNIPMVHELLHSMKHGSEEGINFMALKLDMAKAYDCVEWLFLNAMLHKLGFDETFCEWVMECVQTIFYSVVVKGKLWGTSHLAGVNRQGDPLSPFLFLICAEVLSALLQNEEKVGCIRGMTVSHVAESLSHVFFANDSLAKEIEQVIARFWWKDQKTQKVVHWMAWRKVAKCMTFGGLGFKEIIAFNLAMLVKVGWCIICNPDTLLAKMPQRAEELVVPDGKWEIDVIDRCFNNEEACIMLSLPFSQFGGPDHIIWHYTRNGMYLVKLGYKVAQEMEWNGELGRKGMGQSSEDHLKDPIWLAVW